MYSQEGSGNGQGEQEVTSPSHYIFEQFQNSYQFRILFTNPEKIFELLCPFGGRGWGRDGEKPEDCIFQKVKMLSINKSENVQFQQNTIVEKTKFCLILINHHTDTV